MKKFSTSSGVFTPSELHRSARRLQRRADRVSIALAAMRSGQSLHLKYRGSGPRWSLSSGQVVDPAVAAILLNDASIVPVSGALFSDMPGQSWKLGVIK
jgi:hypothetical protein